MYVVTKHGQLTGTITLMFVENEKVESYDVDAGTLRDMLKSASVQWKETKVTRHKSTAEQLLQFIKDKK